MIREADSRDMTVINGLLETAAYVHRHLDWQGILDWIKREPFLILFEENRLKALLSCAPDPAGVAWVHCFAASDGRGLESAWKELCGAAFTHPAMAKCRMVTVGLQDWFVRLLKKAGAGILQQIVVLRWDRSLPLALPLPVNLVTRPMEENDLDAVAEVDRLSFEPIWSLSRLTLENAYGQAERATVAELDSKIIGYELSTYSHFSAHLARLAVQPQNQLHGIGYYLAREMIRYFYRHGTLHISVNTQDDNQKSLNLYKRLGFNLTGERFPVFEIIPPG